MKINNKKILLQVRVTDIDGRKTTTFQPFALDGSRLSFRILPRLILMSNVSNIVRNIIYIMK